MYRMDTRVVSIFSSDSWQEREQVFFTKCLPDSLKSPSNDESDFFCITTLVSPKHPVEQWKLDTVKSLSLCKFIIMTYFACMQPSSQMRVNYANIWIYHWLNPCGTVAAEIHYCLLSDWSASCLFSEAAIKLVFHPSCDSSPIIPLVLKFGADLLCPGVVILCYYNSSSWFFFVFCCVTP